jgi:uncharacterized protein (DUF39 family)
MKTYEQINDRIESGTAVVLTADEIMDYVDKKGLDAAAEEVDVVTTATFGPMCFRVLFELWPFQAQDPHVRSMD